MLMSTLRILSLFAAVCLGSAAAQGAEKVTTVTTTSTATTTTSTVITKVVVQKKEPVQWKPFKVCVLDFTTVDIKGQKRFLDEKNKPISLPKMSTLNNADRLTMNGVMQGFVRMIDAMDSADTNEANRQAQIRDNAFSRTKALALYRSTVRGEARPVVIGAEYLSAYLGRHGDVFSCMDSSLLTAAMQKLQQSPDFPRDFMLQLAKETGATHLIYGTVSDIRTKTNSFKGYGIETKTTTYQLDVIIKLVDLAAQATVYSNVYTGSYREQRPISGRQFDNNIFQNLMTSALEQAAEDLYDCCRPGRKNRIKVTPLPCMLNVVPAGGMFFKQANAEVFVDGMRAGSGNCVFMVPAGKHTLEVKAPGYKSKKFDLNITEDQVINVKLEK